MTTGAARPAEFVARARILRWSLSGRRPGAQRPVVLASVHDPVRPGRGVCRSALRRHSVRAALRDANADNTRLRNTPSPSLRALRNWRGFMDVSQNQYAETFIKTPARRPDADRRRRAAVNGAGSWDIPLEGAGCATAPACRATTTWRRTRSCGCSSACSETPCIASRFSRR